MPIRVRVLFEKTNERRWFCNQAQTARYSQMQIRLMPEACFCVVCFRQSRRIIVCLLDIALCCLMLDGVHLAELSWIMALCVRKYHIFIPAARITRIGTLQLEGVSWHYACSCRINYHAHFRPGIAHSPERFLQRNNKVWLVCEQDAKAAEWLYSGKLSFYFAPNILKAYSA